MTTINSKSTQNEAEKSTRVHIWMSKKEINFCKKMANVKGFKNVSEYIRHLIANQISPEVKPKFDQHFTDLDQKLDRLIRKSNQFESAFKELLEANGALKGFIVADVNMRDKATLKTIRERIDKSIQEHKELADEIFKSAKSEKGNVQ